MAVDPVAARVTIGIDVGGTKVLGVVLDGTVLGGAEHRTATPHAPDEVIDTIIDVVETLAAAAGDAHQIIDGVGIGVPGLVDDAGSLRFAPNLAALEGYSVRNGLLARLARSPLAAASPDGLALVVDNDATCAIVGERAEGAAAHLDDVVMVTLGTGIGGGVITGGGVLRGAHRFGSEVGHMTVNPGGVPCKCGKRGCWERYASGWGLGRFGRQAVREGRAPHVADLAKGDVDAVRGEHVTAAAATGDAAAALIVEEWASWLGIGLANLAGIFDPACFVIGGGLVAAGDVLLDPARAAFAAMLEGAESRPDVPIVAAGLGQRSGAVGAAVLAREATRSGSSSR